ncbi:MAG: hypothetical protein KBC60_12155 [Haliscomenobacter sp.]|jgi:hypothetical protein|nr:hypothetical protein [Haliscomenobacter sp.]
MYRHWIDFNQYIGYFYKKTYMRRLVIPVEDSIAEIWLNAGPEEKTKILSLFTWLLEKEKWTEITRESFSQMLNAISDKATSAGLTPEVLEEILHED